MELVKTRKRLTEPEVRFFTKQILVAIKVCRPYESFALTAVCEIVLFFVLVHLSIGKKSLDHVVFVVKKPPPRILNGQKRQNLRLLSDQNFFSVLDKIHFERFR